MNHPMYPNGFPQQVQQGPANPYGGAPQVPPMGQGHYGQQMSPPMAGYGYHQQASGSLLGFTNDRFLKGLLIGAAAAYLLTNESVQRTAIKGAVKVWSLLQGGVEEMKERFQDAEAELRSEGQE